MSVYRLCSAAALALSVDLSVGSAHAGTISNSIQLPPATLSAYSRTEVEYQDTQPYDYFSSVDDRNDTRNKDISFVQSAYVGIHTQALDYVDIHSRSASISTTSYLDVRGSNSTSFTQNILGLTYYLEIVSKSNNTPKIVTANVKADGSASISNLGGDANSSQRASARLDIQTATNDIIRQAIVSSYGGTGEDRFTLDNDFDFLTYTPYRVELDVNTLGDLAANGGSFPNPSADNPSGKLHYEYRASIDPIFSIASSIPDASDYTILLSAGVGNGLSAVPLPASAPMFGAGLMALGAVGYGLKRKGKAAT